MRPPPHIAQKELETETWRGETGARLPVLMQKAAGVGERAKSACGCVSTVRVATEHTCTRGHRREPCSQ